MDSLPNRAEWIANSAPFWPLVWRAQDALGIPRYRDGYVARPLPANLIAVLEPVLTARRWHAPYCEIAASDGFPPPPAVGDERERRLTWFTCLLAYAVKIVDRLRLASSDTTFVAHCIYGGIETFLFGVTRAEPTMRIGVGGRDAPPASGEVYVVVTDAADLQRDFALLIPAIEAEKARIALFYADQRRRSGPGRGPLHIVPALAWLLHSRHGPLRDGHPMTWNDVMAVINRHFDRVYVDSEDLEQLVRRWRRTVADSGAARDPDDPDD